MWRDNAELVAVDLGSTWGDRSSAHGHGPTRDVDVQCAMPPRRNVRDAALQTTWGSADTRSVDTQTATAATTTTTTTTTTSTTSTSTSTDGAADEAAAARRAADADAQGFIAFLQKIVPDVCEQLDANLTSHVFDNYVATWDETADSIQQTANLKFAHPEAQEYACTSVSWSCTGSILASAHGVPTHSGWCSHRGYENMWAVFKKSLRNQTKPQLVVELGSCAMCILCHPLRPSIVAVGTFNGEIVLIDVDATEDPTIGTTNLNDVNAHREPVTALCWLTSGRSKTTELASSSGDGKVIVWAWENIRGAGKLSIARLMHLKGRSDQATLVAGLSAMSFFCQEVNHLVVGTEGGKLMKCSIMAPLAVGREKATPHASTTTNAAAAAAQAPPIQSSGSVQFNYEDLRLPIFCIAASPSHPNVFLSTCADGAVRLHNALVSKPNIVLVPPGGESTTPLCVAWSTTRPTVFATGCSDGFLHIYDLSHPEGTIRPVASVCVSKNSAVTSVAFSGGSVQGYIATSTNKGIVKIWQLSHHLVFLRPDDSAILASHGTLKANKGS